MEELQEVRGEDQTTLYKFFIDGEEEPINDRAGITQHKLNIFFAIPYKIPQPQRFRSGSYKFIGTDDRRENVSRFYYNISKVTKSYATIKWKYIHGERWTNEHKLKIRYDESYDHGKTKIEGFYLLLQGCGYTGCDNYRLYFSDLEEE